MMGGTGNAQIVHLHFEVRRGTTPGSDVALDINAAFRPCRNQVVAGPPIPSTSRRSPGCRATTPSWAWTSRSSASAQSIPGCRRRTKRTTNRAPTAKPPTARGSGRRNTMHDLHHGRSVRAADGVRAGRGRARGRARRARSNLAPAGPRRRSAEIRSVVVLGDSVAAGEGTLDGYRYQDRAAAPVVVGVAGTPPRAYDERGPRATGRRVRTVQIVARELDASRDDLRLLGRDVRPWHRARRRVRQRRARPRAGDGRRELGGLRARVRDTACSRRARSLRCRSRTHRDAPTISDAVSSAISTAVCAR